MKLWERTPGYYMFWTGAVYLIGGLLLIYSDWREYSGFVAPIWILFLMMPFIIPPFGRWLNLSVDWDKKMFNWFKDKKETNVVDFPAPKAVPKVPEVKQPEPPKEKDPVTFYRLGLTDNNRVSFYMGYSEITMNHEGVQQMIDQLKFFQSQINDDNDIDPDDPDGGEPVPVPEKKAA